MDPSLLIVFCLCCALVLSSLAGGAFYYLYIDTNDVTNDVDESSAQYLPAAGSVQNSSVQSSVPAATGCNKAACNAVMYDYILNKQWAFAPGVFAECAQCPTRGYSSQKGGYKDGKWEVYGSESETYTQLKL